ncbi:MAG TPA: hypothetical protein VFS25_15225 [Chitinophaga sp.]|uniref:hypothetical protein n=1 Tax=Chitinophaga sp. TaxID=1869181 RepID=UPI002DBAB27F|nr:hypothetical protein [Chitinophaga sp.]HEU4554195.1 hypothetical protein [Chitinophaga sp.]
MEHDPLKAAWQEHGSAAKSNIELRQMLQEGKHPVLKRIRRQMIVEALAFTAFLCVYYNAFDGNRKPMAANVLLVTAMLLAVVHSIISYWFTKRYGRGNNLQQSLYAQLSGIKIQAVLSVATRVLMAVCLLLFFTSVIHFTVTKYWLLGGIVVIFLGQMVLLGKMWAMRVRQLKATISSLFS